MSANAVVTGAPCRVVRHPDPRPSEMGMARTYSGAEAAIADMGSGVVVASDGRIVAFHERHLSVLVRRGQSRVTPEATS